MRITQGVQDRYFKYDSLGNLIYERQPEQVAPYAASDSLTGNSGWSRRVEYNSEGLVSDVYDAKGTHAQWTYDGLNRVTQTLYSDDTPGITYFYDQSSSPSTPNKDRLTEVRTAQTATKPATSVSFSYNSAGQITTQSQTVGTTTYNTNYFYNLAGQLTYMSCYSSVGSSAVYARAYNRDSIGRLVSIGGERMYASAMTYDAAGNLRWS